MTKNLTCKMSDGTEWEVVAGPIQLVAGPTAYLRPIKREPRQWWCVIFSTAFRQRLCQSEELFDNKDDAARWAHEHCRDDYEIIKVREVIE